MNCDLVKRFFPFTFTLMLRHASGVSQAKSLLTCACARTMPIQVKFVLRRRRCVASVLFRVVLLTTWVFVVGVFSYDVFFFFLIPGQGKAFTKEDKEKVRREEIKQMKAKYGLQVS